MARPGKNKPERLERKMWGLVNEEFESPDLRDTREYAEGVVSIDNFIDRNPRVKLNDIVRAFPQFQRVITDMIGSLESVGHITTSWSGITWIERVTDEERARVRRLKRTRADFNKPSKPGRRDNSAVFSKAASYPKDQMLPLGK